MSDCPSPLEWHPWYRGKAELIDWLNGTSQELVIPVRQRMSGAEYTTDIPTADLSFTQLRLTKQRAWGPALWVGRPFHYEWNVATDTLGRSIAGESRIVYDQMYAGMPAEWWPSGGI